MYYMFRELNKKVSYQIIFRFSLSMFLSNLSSSLGLQKEPNINCWILGIGTNIFTLSGIFWLLYLTYFLYSIVKHRTRYIFKQNIIIEIICWGIPTLVTLLPLVNTTYGVPTNKHNTETYKWCWVVATDNSPEWALQFWFWMSFYLWVWMAIILIILLLIRISCIQKNKVKDERKSTMTKTLTNLTLYPIVFITCWLPSTIIDYLDYKDIYYDYNEIISYIGNILAVSMGFFSFLVLYFSNIIIHSLIVKLYKAHFNLSLFRLQRRISDFTKRTSLAK